MRNRRALLIRSAALAAALALAACDAGPDEAELASLDNQIIGNDTDPALTSALEDQILVDPELSQQSNGNAVRPPETPVQGQYPVAQPSPAGPAAAPKQPGQAGAAPADMRSGRSAAAAPAAGPVRTAAAGGGIADIRRDMEAESGSACGAAFNYNPGWARRLPGAFAVYPGARVTQAAGNNAGDCRVRVVTFLTRANHQQVLDWYHTKAVRAGYSSEHQLREGDHVLAGVHGGNGGAFYVIVSPLPRGGSDVALIANNGS
ncbi:MAG TPA: hypothetical protein VF605_20280 [Allosphingosinicella sp.]|jgi:hypothetical protein